MKRHDYWYSMEEEANGWLQGGINPQTVFSYLNLDTILREGTDLVTMKYDPKLILWFHYVTKYRLKDSTGSDYAHFNNKDFLEFLAEHIRLQNGIKLTLSLHDKSPFNPYVPVVSLFDSYRDEPGMKEFAADMLTYLVTDSITKDLLLEEWLLKKESPENIFNFFLLGENHAHKVTDDVTLFTAWLIYVKKCLNSGASDFDIGHFLEKQLAMMSTPRAMVMFESNAVENVLGDVRYQTGSLAAHVRGIWQRFPQVLFSYWYLFDEKITSATSFSFVSVIKSIAFYVESKAFDGDLVIELLNVKNSFDEVVDLFQKLKQKAYSINYLRPDEFPIVKNYAHTMVQYHFDSSSKLRTHGHPDTILVDLIARNAEASVIKKLFVASVAYHQRVENELLNEAINKVIHLLQRKLPNTGDSHVSWRR